MGNWTTVVGIIVLLLLIGVVATLMLRGSGEEAMEAAEQTRDEFTGKRVLEQGDRVKQQVRGIGADKKAQFDSVLGGDEEDEDE